MKIIARIRSDFPTKFGIPRQSGRVEELTARVVFEPEYRVREAVKGMEDFSHISSDTDRWFCTIISNVFSYIS